MTPVFQGDVFQGLRQQVIGSPPSGSPAADQLPSARFLWAGREDAYLRTSDDGFLRVSDAGWETRDRDGMARTTAAPAVTRVLSQSVPYYDGYGLDFPSDLPPLVAPPRSVLPDAVVQAWLPRLALPPAEERTAAPHAAQRRMAWVRQRFPQYLTPAASLPPGLWRPPTDIAPPRPDVSEGQPYRLVLDLADPNWFWYGGSRPRPGTTGQHSANRDAVLWRLPAREVDRWRFTRAEEGRLIVQMGAVPFAGAKAFPLPVLPTRLHLRVEGVSTRPDGLYVGTSNGALRFSPSALTGPGAANGTAYLPFGTSANGHPFSFDAYKIREAGSGLLVDANVLDAPLMRWESDKQCFSAASDLPRESILFATRIALSTRVSTQTVRSDGSESPSVGTVRYTSLNPDGTASSPSPVTLLLPGSPDDKAGGSGAISLRGPGYPFSKPDAYLVGATGSTLWFTGPVTHLDKPRYAHPDGIVVLAGYDVARRSWTRALEAVSSVGLAFVSVREQNGQTVAATLAPDTALWRYEEGRDGWTPIAPALPPAAREADGSGESPKWVQQSGDVWIVRGWTAYHWAAGQNRWDTFPAPKFLRSGGVTPPTVALWRDGLFVGGDVGLWCFDICRHVWQEVAPRADALPGTSSRLVIDYIAADRKRVYVSGWRSAGDRDNFQGGFLLSLDKKTGRWAEVSPAAFGLDRFRSTVYLTSDSLAAYLIAEYTTFRRDSTTDAWVKTDHLPSAFAAVLPALPGVQWVLTGGQSGRQRIERVDRRTGTAHVVFDTGSLPEENDFAAASHSGQRVNLSVGAIASGRNALYFVVGQSLYKINSRGAVQPLPISALPGRALLPRADGGVHYWNGDTVAILPR